MVRIKNCDVDVLPHYEFLGEEREVHIVWNDFGKEYVLTNMFPTFYKFLHDNKIHIGYLNHPNVQCFRGHLGQIIDRHNQHIEEFKRRGYNHKSPLIPMPFSVELEPYSYSSEANKKELYRLKKKLKTMPERFKKSNTKKLLEEN